MPMDPADGFGLIASALALIVLMIAAATVFVRRRWLRAAGIERQLGESRNRQKLQDDAERRRAEDGQAGDPEATARDLP